ncbi:MAG: hypothetical protein ACOCRO_08015 [Halanaerobiales bacterium]
MVDRNNNGRTPPENPNPLGNERKDEGQRVTPSTTNPPRNPNPRP